MDSRGVDAAVILGFAWRSAGLLREHNDMILSDSASSGGRLLGFPCIYPFAPSGDAAAEASRCLDAGAAGIGEVGLYDRDLDSEYIDAMAPVMAACREFDCPVMMHVNEPIGHAYSGKAPMTVSGIYNFVRAFPDNRIILAHWGGGLLFYASLKKEVGPALRNVWFDSAASPLSLRSADLEDGRRADRPGTDPLRDRLPASFGKEIHRGAGRVRTFERRSRADLLQERRGCPRPESLRLRDFQPVIIFASSTIHSSPFHTRGLMSI